MTKIKSYNVLVYPSAQNDLKEIKKYFTDVLKTKSNSVFNKFLEQVQLLKKHPFVYPVHSDPFLRLIQYRVFAIDNDLVFYVVKENEVQIHRVLYAKRNFVELLKIEQV